MRAKRAAYNSIASLLYRIAIVAAGLILPRLILSHFGSEYFGVVGSITQFIGFISILSAGIGEVTISALFKPLAEQDTAKISGIVRATEIFMRKVALIFVGILIAIAALYPLLVLDEFGWVFVFTLTLILGAGTFLQYYFGITYTFLVSADQRVYVFTIVQICTVILNTVIAALLILAGNDIRMVYLASAVVFAINPIFIYLYARSRYNIDYTILPDNDALRQRWDAFVHQVGYFVNANIPIVILTVFTGILEVSVFVIYNMIIITMRAFIINLAGSGIAFGFGDMLARGEDKTLKDGLRLYEFTCNTIAVFLLTCTAVLIVPFITVYTLGVDDVSYYRPLFAIIFCVTEFYNIAPHPYQSIVNAAGHFRKTRNLVIVQMGIHIIISVVLVQWLGIVGVAIGALCSHIYRSVVFAYYVSRHLVVRRMWLFVRRMVVSALTAAVIFAIASFLPGMTETTYLAWVLYALPVFGVAVGVSVVSALLFYRDEVKMLPKILRSVVKG